DLGQAYRHKAQYEEALSEIKKAVTTDREDSFGVSQLGHTYAVLGRTGEAYKAVEQLKEQAKRSHVLPWDIAVIYAGLAEKDRAFEWLEKAFGERDEDLLYLKVAPVMDSLRSDPRFTDLLRRIGFPQ